MPEEDSIHADQPTPVTVESLLNDFRDLGVAEGQTLLVHSALSKLGWVCGGPVAVVQALLAAIGKSGTLVMPTHSADLSEPSLWSAPPVPEDWWDEIRRTMPAFDPSITPSRGMGHIPECFRTFPGVIRSSHPQVSFAAIGPDADAILSAQVLEDGLGESSPLGKIYHHNGRVLLLGVGHENNTSLHLAEVRACRTMAPNIQTGAPMKVDGQRKWVRFTEQELDSSDFAQLGEDMEAQTALVTTGLVGKGVARLMSQPAIVDFAHGWFERHRRTP